MKINKSLIFTIISGIALMLTIGCESLEDTYRQFIGSGETIYIGKADSIKTRGGRNRIELSWLILSDPKVSSYKVYWNNMNDSIEGEIVRTDDVDTVRIMFENMEERIYQFDIFQYDAKGNSSIRSSHIGTVYGENYERTLVNRTYNSIERSGIDLVIRWSMAGEDVASVEIKYRNTWGEDVVKYSHPKSDADTLFNFPIGGSFEYRTLYLPEPMALDLFYSAPNTITLNGESGRELDKSLFSNLALEDDSFQPKYSSNALSNLWDGMNSTAYFMQASPSDLPSPNWVSIDLGKKYILTTFRVNNLAHHESGWVYKSSAVKRFQLWASNVPQTNPNWRNDGSWDFLGEFEVIKPSGLPIGQNSPEDIEEHIKGHSFDLTSNGNAYRYVRFVNIETWGGVAFFGAMEFTFFGFPIE